MKRIACCVLAAAMPVLAQTDRGTLTGTITDSSGARMPDASITIKQMSNDVNRTSQTDGQGVYSIASLLPGRYTVTITAPAFATRIFENLQIDAGVIRILSQALQPAASSTEVNVSVADSGLARASAEIGSVVQGEQTRDLPLNGRNYVSLVALVPGAIDSGTGTQDQVRFAGLSAEDNTWLLDGVDNSGINHQYQKIPIRLQPSTDAIAEFRANSAVYSADQGGTAGGQINLVSRSGTSQFHGAAWDYLRNNIFDAAPWGANGTLPPLRLNDFGANLGGPALRGKLFFFANYEAIRQIQTQVLTGFVPSDAFRTAVTTASPALRSVIAMYPVGTVATSNANVSTWFGSGRSLDHEDSGLARMDYRINERTSAFARYSTDHFLLTAPGNLTGLTQNTLVTPSIVLGLQRTFSPFVLNDAHFGFNRAAFVQGETQVLPTSIVVPGLTKLDDATGTIRYDNSFTITDDLTLVRGRHTIKAGVTLRRIQENRSSPSAPDEVVSYTSLATFQANVVNQDQYGGATPVTGQRMTQSFAYVQDQFQLSPQLTINAGLRYEYFGVDHEVLGRGVVVEPFLCPKVICPAGTQWFSPNLADFSPRVSVAYAPAYAKGKLAVRAGFGIYYGDGQFGNLGQPITNLTTRYTLSQKQSPGLSYPVAPTPSLAAASSSPSSLQGNRRDTAVNEWTASVQQEIMRRTVLQVAYFGTKAAHVYSDQVVNGIDPATGKPPFASFSLIDYRGTLNDAHTHALQMGVQRDISTGLLVSANYEWSHSIDNGGIGGGEAVFPQDYRCHACEIANSDQDMRHYFSASSIWQLPVGRGHTYLSRSSGLTEALLGGWQFSSIGTARAGLPINVTISRSTADLPDSLTFNQRPDLVPGVPLYTTKRTPALWLNPLAFRAPAPGVHGNAGRNIARAPGLWQFDSAIEKRFAIKERLGVRFRTEAFNLFNVAHYGRPASVFAAPTATSNNPANFGVIQTSFNSQPIGTGTPRELEFLLKIDF